MPVEIEPTVEDFHRSAFPNQTDEGMSLREWFAGHALAGTLARGDAGGYSETPEGFAAFARDCADALLVDLRETF